jgi:hypothetical protein
MIIKAPTTQPLVTDNLLCSPQHMSSQPSGRGQTVVVVIEMSLFFPLFFVVVIEISLILCLRETATAVSHECCLSMLASQSLAVRVCDASMDRPHS